MEDKKRNFHVIVSRTTQNGIGFKNTKPWYIEENIAFFKGITTHYKQRGQKKNGVNAVIMGRKTFEYILNKAFLWNRINVIVTQKK